MWKPKKGIQGIIKKIEASGALLASEGIVGTSRRHWLEEAMPFSYRTGFFEYVGSMFGGDPEATAVYLLDAWATRGDGLRWLFQPVEPPRVEQEDPILKRTFTQTQEAVLRRAVAETGGDVREAILRSIIDQLTRWGFMTIDG